MVISVTRQCQYMGQQESPNRCCNKTQMSAAAAKGFA